MSYPKNYRGHNIRQEDGMNRFTPVEKYVDVALASTMVSRAKDDNSYDVAVIVTGDCDYIPAIKIVRNLGKRVAIASIKTSCSQYYTDPEKGKELMDYEKIWLDDHLNELYLDNGKLETPENGSDLNTFNKDIQSWLSNVVDVMDSS